MKIIQSPLLNNFTNLTHCFTTKEIGNLAFHVGDNSNSVHVNHNNLSQLMNYDKNSLIHMKQIHSNDVHVVTPEDSFQNPKECDALITNKKNTPLMVMVADCSPILFYESKQNVIAVAHAGRQGAFKNIIKNTLNTMSTKFNTNIDNVHVSIGASIGECCYEVGPEIYEEACKKGLEYSIKQKNGKYFLNISRILESQLLACGVKATQIEISEECSCCKNDKYYSYRANPNTGRFAGVISLL